MTTTQSQTTAHYQVTGMTCGHCERAVTQEVGHIPGVTAVEVSAVTGRLVVTSTSEVAEAEILTAVEEAGYEAVRSRP